MEYTGINLESLQDKDMILLLENKVRGRISSVMGNRYVKSDENTKILYIDANNLYGHSLSQPLPYDEIKLDNNVKLEDILITPDDSDIGYIVEARLINPDKKKRKQRIFHLLLWIRKLIPIIIMIIWNQLNVILIYKIKKWYVIGLIRKIIWYIIGCWIFL